LHFFSSHRPIAIDDFFMTGAEDIDSMLRFAGPSALMYLWRQSLLAII